ncbi:GNAT family N-acetyltransferase [Nonomuraea sp. NPDC001831]|uniref:GNAT family N-acetyltransferase n=1 Tax=Nonomuraea sp. NPDC001831 TaxID=3364340 RepID=UPI0036BBD08E
MLDERAGRLRDRTSVLQVSLLGIDHPACWSRRNSVDAGCPDSRSWSVVRESAGRLWAGLAGVPGVPGRGEVAVVVSRGSGLCPPGWTGIVVLDGGALVTVPDAGLVEPLRRALRGGFGEDGVDLPRLSERLSDGLSEGLFERLEVREVLGPATLAYVDAEEFVPCHAGAEVERLAVGDRDVGGLLAAVSEQDADESGLAEVGSAVWVVRAEGGEVVAAAGYQAWSDMAAHVSVLTAEGFRGRGLARTVASAAVADALGAGLLPQWRARPEASRRVARALGFRELGSQVSLRVER